MDDTQQSRASDVASRKRRSSILKSQRPARTPFCELEFNVTTPPDTTKSRRVSFSRRTGVAEFATNEATTTWKNFYEEHNKSLESSGNESVANGTKQTVGHLGKRLFDEQFEEVEVIDFTGRPGINVSNSINNVNFTLECTDKLAPSNFELSAFTEQRSKVFGDDVIGPSVGEVSECIDINFSNVQQIGGKDDLDEIQQDIQRQSCHGFNDRQNMSEYIEVDLDMTHVEIRQDESDMSITDTIRAPKVQDVSKSCSIDKKVNIGKVWDKENIVMNPYVAPRESLNFAINEDPENVLVFDGKKLIVQNEKPKDIPEIAQRKTIVLNCDDDLPNFVDNSKNVSGFVEKNVSNNMSNKDKSQNHQTILYDDDSCNISITKAAYPNELSIRRRTVLYDNDANMSVTQAVPLNIIDNQARNVTYESENGNISVTKALSGVIMSNEIKLKEKTVVYENEACDISMTQALPPNIISEKPSEKRKTIHFDDNAGNVSMMQAIPNIVIKDKSTDKRRTIVYEKDTGNISVTQVISTNVILIENAVPERRRTVVFENDNCNISVTQSVPTNIILPPVKTPAESDINISMTQGVPSNIFMGEKSMNLEKSRSVIYNNETGDISVTQAVPNQIFTEVEKLNNKDDQSNQPRRRTVLFNNEDGDISVTQAVNINQLLSDMNMPEKAKKTADSVNNRTTVDGNVDKDQAVSVETNKGEGKAKRKTIVFENDDADISMTAAVSVNKLLSALNQEDNKPANVKRRGTIMYDDANISVTQAIPSNILKRQSVFFDDNDISMTQAIPAHILAENKSLFMEIDNLTNDSERKLDISKDLKEQPPKMDNDSKRNLNILMDLKEPPPKITDDSQRKLDISMDLEEPPSKITDDSQRKLDISTDLEEPPTKITDDSQRKLDISTDLKEQPLKITNDSERKLDISTDLKEPPLESPEIAPEVSRKISLIKDTSQISNENEDAAKSDLLKSFDNKNDAIKPVNDIIVYQAVTLNQNEEKDYKSDCKSQDISMEDVAMSTDDNNELLEIKASTSIQENHDISMLSLRNEGISTVSYPISTTKTSEITMGDFNKSAMAVTEKQELVTENGLTAENLDVQDVTLTTNLPSVPCLVKSETTSNDSLFYITKDIPDSEKSAIEQKSAHDEEKNGSIQKKLSEIKTALKEERSYKQESSSPVNKTLGSSIMDVLKKGVHYSRKKSFRSANDTEELLNMLSDFSDMPQSKTINENLAEEEERHILTTNDKRTEVENKTVGEDHNAMQEREKPSAENDINLKEEPKPITHMSRLAIEDKSDKSEPEKVKEIEPKINIQRRISVALSREDLLNNISMAVAALQKSRMELDDSDSVIDTSKETPDEEMSPKKTVRMSSDVVKTLHFEEESSDVIVTDTKLASFKKTAFGEVSYMKEGKNRVIPDYTTDMSLGVKELMDDLVKPMADVLPYDTSLEKNSRKIPSTSSTQIQANLITSSQVDLTSEELTSHPESVDDFNKMSSSYIISEAVQRSLRRAMKSPISTKFDTSSSFKSFDTGTISEDKPQTLAKPRGVEQDQVLIFDQNNPLNNILLAPPGPVEVHKYNPNSSGESISISPESQSHQDFNREQVSEYCFSENLKMRSYDGSQSGILSNVTKVQSIDRAIEVKNETLHAEVNTVIAMKGNKELLDASSSLTLVDDALAPSDCNVPMEKESDIRDQSPVRVIFKGLENAPEKLDSDLTSNDDLHENLQRAKKRMYSPSQRDHKMFTKSEVTPKPVSKMQRTSSTPENKDKPEYMDLTTPPEKEESMRKRSPKKIKYREPTITVQQLLTEYNVRDIDHEYLKSQIKDALYHSDGSSLELVHNKLEVVGVSAMTLSSSSSKNMKDESISQKASESSRLDSGTDEDCFKKAAIKETDSGVNVVAKIDMLPFMGSSECEWESSSGDTWSFRLLHGRLRLVVRLEHRHDNAARTVVKADTRVLNLGLDTTREEKDPLAHLCVQFAASTMRWAISTKCTTAGQLPTLLRRLAAIARASARWTRAMLHTRLRLAYTLTRDGLLTLNVANIPLRSVWQVTMKIELCTDEGVAPYPRATDVCVSRVLADCCVTRADTQKVLAHCSSDWGHAPKAIWKIFKYLKHKTHEDNLFNL